MITPLLAGGSSGGLVAIAIILAAIGLPVEAIGLILAVDRVLDMCRTSVNVFSDSCGTVIIARLTGEKGVLGEPSLLRTWQPAGLKANRLQNDPSGTLCLCDWR